jgi:hypothetical protein
MYWTDLDCSWLGYPIRKLVMVLLLVHLFEGKGLFQFSDAFDGLRMVEKLSEFGSDAAAPCTAMASNSCAGRAVHAAVELAGLGRPANSSVVCSGLSEGRLRLYAIRAISSTHASSSETKTCSREFARWFALKVPVSTV